MAKKIEQKYITAISIGVGMLFLALFGAYYSYSELKGATIQDAVAIIKENKNNPDFVILDVRTSGEYKLGHLPNAVSRNFYDPNFQENLKELDSKKTYLVYCQSGFRSTRAMLIMKQEGFLKIYNMGDGFAGWEAANLPISMAPPE